MIGPEGFGNWTILIACGAMFHNLLLGWTQTINVRFGCEEWGKSKSIAKTWAMRWPWIVGGVLISGLLLAFQPAAFLHEYLKLPSGWWPLALLYVLGLWFMTEFQSLMQITGKMYWLASAPILVDTVTIVFVLALMALPIADKTEIGIMGLVFVMVGMWGTFWITAFIKLRLGIKVAPAKEVMETLRYSWALIPVAVAGYLSDWSNHLLLQIYHSSVEVALFQTSFQVMGAILILASSVTVLMLPRLIERKLSDVDAEQKYLIREIPTISSLWILFIIPWVTILPWLFMLVFGKQFHQGTSVLLILSLVLPGAIFSYLYTVLYNAQSRIGRASAIHWLMTAVGLILSIALIPEYGVKGAALGTAASYLFSQYLYIFDNHRHLNLSPKLPVTLLSVSLLFGLAQIFAGIDFYYRFIVGAVFFLGIVYVMRRFSIVSPEILTILIPDKYGTLKSFGFRLLVR